MKKLALIALLCITVSCSQRETKVTGSVFVVTNSMQNVPLGGIKVFVFPEKEFKDHIAKVEQERSEISAHCESYRSKPLDSPPPDECILSWNLGPSNFYMEKPPTPVAIGTTEADGKFQLSIPTKGRYGVFASSNRTLKSELETYRGLAWMDADGSDMHLVLDNSKLLSD